MRHSATARLLVMAFLTIGVAHSGDLGVFDRPGARLAARTRPCAK